MLNKSFLESMHFFRMMADNLPDMLWAKDTQGRYLFANKAICDNLLMARDTDEPIGKTDLFFAKRERAKHPDNPEWHTFGELCADSDQITLKAMKPMRFEEFGNVKGKLLYLEVHKAPFFDDEGNLLGTVGSGRDITRQKELEEELKRTSETFRMLLESTLEGVCLLDEAMHCIQANAALEAMSGYDAEILENIPLVDKLIAPFFREAARQLFSKPTTEPFELEIVRKDGRSIPVLCRHREMELFGKRLKVVNLLDISDIKEARKKIEQMAYYDELTGLPNRTLFLQHLKQAVRSASRNGSEHALLFLDLDNFKKLNDTAGHDAGDQLLKEVAQRIEHAIRRSNIASRFGGDEFVILLNDVAPGLALEERIEAIRDHVMQPFLIDQDPPVDFQPRFSMGVVYFDGDTPGTNELLKEADLALYEAKRAGRSRIRYYNNEMARRVRNQMEIEQRLEEALRRGEMTVHYQPQTDKEGRMIGAEALCRWAGPEPILTPADFIPVAESSGQIIRLGRHIFETVLSFLREHGKQLPEGVRIAINISVKQFLHPNFAAWVEETLARFDVPADRLTFELTESIFVHDFESVSAIMRRLADLGITLSLDDFGTGFSSLGYLKRLPFHELKIDRLFIEDMAENDGDLAIVKAVVGIAASMGMRCIAEGIENDTQRTTLEAIDCRYFQGFYFAKPMPPEQLLAWIKEHQ